MEISCVVSIAKKELMDNIRSKWILIVSFIFAFLAVIVSYFGSYGQGWQDLDLTIAGMMIMVQYLIPIIGLMLGYAAIVGEIERGSMNSFVTLPITRLEIILGKFLGLGSVLSISILIGFGIAGAVIGINVSDVNYVDYLIFIGASILLGLVFLSVSLFFSSLFKRRSTSMGMAIFLWFFFTMIWGIIMTGILFITIDIQEIISSEAIPDWYFGISMINPLSAYSGLVSLNVVPVSDMGAGIEFSYPSFYSTGTLLLILIIWIITFLLMAYWRFKKSDI